MTRPSRLRFFLTLALVTSPAWSQDSPPEPAPLPPGHPAVRTPAAPDESLPPVPAGAGRGAAALLWTVPEGWLAESPTSSMRRAQYRIPGAGDAGDAECVVYYFGPGQGGTPEANAERWAEQLTPRPGTDPAEATRRERKTVDGMPVLLIEGTGTYRGGFGGGPALEDALLLGAIVEGPDANWYFKATGPAATLAPHRGAFTAMIESLRRGSIP